ncbi:hypothetical protein [Xenorhabdus sp. Sc-CR9]|nr:hypothetical protein [Xenorhabdus sp. Sc-CR9]
MDKVVKIDVKSLKCHHLHALCTGDSLAIIIPNFVQPEAIDRAKGTSE